MNPFRTIAQLLRAEAPKAQPGRTSLDGERLTAPEMKDLLEDRCPDCQRKGGFEKGPEGGLSCNFRCPGCGSRFNAMGPLGVDRISDKSPGRTE